MPEKGWKSITVRETVVKKLKTMYDQDIQRPQNQKFGAWVDETITGLIDYEDFIRKHAMLRFKGAFGNEIHIYDSFKQSNVIVTIDGAAKTLRCEFDPSNPSCIHIGFCYGLKDTARILKHYGVKN